MSDLNPEESPSPGARTEAGTPIFSEGLPDLFILGVKSVVDELPGAKEILLAGESLIPQNLKRNCHTEQEAAAILNHASGILLAIGKTLAHLS